MRKATDQSIMKLSYYFEMCRSLGVLNATKLPLVEGGNFGGRHNGFGEELGMIMERLEIVMTKDWVVFGNEFTEAKHSYP